MTTPRRTSKSGTTACRRLAAPTVALLPRIGDSLSSLYLDIVRLHQDDTGVCAAITTKERGTELVYLPTEALSCLMLGPGTSITAQALATLARHGTTVVCRSRRTPTASPSPKPGPPLRALPQADPYALPYWRRPSDGLPTVDGEALDHLAVDQDDETAAAADAVFDLTFRRAVVGHWRPQLRFRRSRLVADGAAVVRRRDRGCGSHSTNMASPSRTLQPLHRVGLTRDERRCDPQVRHAERRGAPTRRRPGLPVPWSTIDVL